MATENLLKKILEIKGNSEASEEINRFKVYREIRGNNQEVIVQIFDLGETANPHYRYYCIARTSTGETTAGNADSSPENAIDRVHWGNLDRKGFGNYKDRG